MGSEKEVGLEVISYWLLESNSLMAMTSWLLDLAGLHPSFRKAYCRGPNGA